MSRAHLDDVKALPCVSCGRMRDIDPHHLMRGLPPEERGVSRKASDRWAIPLCRTCHDAAHHDGDDERWLTARQVDGRSVAQSLWGFRGDRRRMLGVIVRRLNERGIYVNV